jgi:hypothetical protein
MSKNRVKAFDAPFVGITSTVLDSLAWKAMSPYARVVYLAIKRKYNHVTNNNGHLYLPSRAGAKETGLSEKTVLKCIHENIHYGFVVVTRGASLGVNGHGRPTKLRLTEVGTRADKKPTRDFLKWDGVLFSSGQSHGTSNLLPRLRDDQDGNGIPGTCVPKNRTLQQTVTHPAVNRHALVQQTVTRSNCEVQQTVTHMEAEGAVNRHANLVIATRVASGGSK